MSNEETKIMASDTKSQQSSTSENTQSIATDAPETRKSDMAKNAAFAAGGFAAGVAATATVNAMGAESVESEPEEEPATQEEPQGTEEVQHSEDTNDEESQSAVSQNELDPVTTIDEGEIPEAHDAILTTDEGVRVAQVNDDMSFSQAFADARAQVGAGGVFEWHGKVYGTYYKDEWDHMSRSERAEFQSKVDYQDVMDADASARDVASHVQSTEHHSHHESAVHHTSYEPVEHDYSDAADSDVHPGSEEHVAQTEDEGLEVIAAGPVEMPNGEVHNAAVLDYGGDQAMIVDVDDDGDFDVIIHDDNRDGQISYNEFHDINDGAITYDDVNAHISAQEDPNGIVAYNDDMPDYMNDADAGIYEA